MRRAATHAPQHPSQLSSPARRTVPAGATAEAHSTHAYTHSKLVRSFIGRGACLSCFQALLVFGCVQLRTPAGIPTQPCSRVGLPRSVEPVDNPTVVPGLTSYASFMHIARKVALPQPAAAGLGKASSLSLSFVGTQSSRSSGSSKVGSRAPTMLYRCFSPVGSPAMLRRRAHLPPAGRSRGCVM